MSENPALSFPVGRRPELTELVEVAPGIHWIRMAIPIPGLEFINLWAIQEDGGWTVVDTGTRSSRIQGWWQAIFDGAFQGKPVTRVICTHFHPDHIGQAGFLCGRFGAPLWMTLTDWTFGRMLAAEASAEVPVYVLDFYRRIGFGEAALDAFRERGFNNFARQVEPIPSQFVRIAEADRIDIGGRQWQVIIGRGHSHEHASLYCAELGVLISGDMVLPKISPHIGVYPGEPEANPLKLFLGSLDSFRHLPADTLVLPSHGDPFVGLHTRLDQLVQHHDVRLTALKAFCTEPRTALDTVPVLFKRQLDLKHTFMAIGESLAHLHYLVADGSLERFAGADGVHRYRRTAIRADAA